MGVGTGVSSKPDQLAYNLAFLAWGATMLIAAWLLVSAGQREELSEREVVIR